MPVELYEPHTKPETFILESLSQADENAGRMDGKVLFDILRIQEKNPVYYYFRKKTELKKFAEAFNESKYRYLHLSCHGSPTVIDFTFERCAYLEFADMFEKKLNNKRVFLSGCSLGNKQLSDLLFDKNKGMYSLTAPAKDVFFSQTSTFWPTFYYMMHSYDNSMMKKDQLDQSFRVLSKIFEIKLAHYFNNTRTKSLEERIYDYENGSYPEGEHKKGVDAGNDELTRTSFTKL